MTGVLVQQCPVGSWCIQEEHHEGECHHQSRKVLQDPERGWDRPSCAPAGTPCCSGPSTPAQGLEVKTSSCPCRRRCGRGSSECLGRAGSGKHWPITSLLEQLSSSVQGPGPGDMRLKEGRPRMAWRAIYWGLKDRSMGLGISKTRGIPAIRVRKGGLLWIRTKVTLSWLECTWFILK